MKSGFFRWLLTEAFRYSPAISLLVLTYAGCQAASSSFMQALIVLAGTSLAVTIADCIQLKQRVARLELLLTALDPESAGYRKEITDYDRSTKPLVKPGIPLVLMPDE